MRTEGSFGVTALRTQSSARTYYPAWFFILSFCINFLWRGSAGARARAHARRRADMQAPAWLAPARLCRRSRCLPEFPDEARPSPREIF